MLNLFHMKISNIFKLLAAFSLAVAAMSSCTRELAPDYDDGYGYVQVKLYKAASYQDGQSKAIQTQLDYLREACKVKISLEFEGEMLSQTLVFQQTGKDEAEFGLRSEKLKLYRGEYKLQNFTLYDALDQELYVGIPVIPAFKVESGRMTMVDLTANVVARGKVNFTFTKDFSGFDSTPVTKAVNRQYTFDEIRYVDITVANRTTGERFTFNKLKTKFKIDFSKDPEIAGSGYQTSYLTTVDELEIKAGEYGIVSYNTYSSDNILLERNNNPVESLFRVEDNKKTEAEVALTLYEADEYIKDYYALYEIWKSLDGPNWYYNGTDHNRGSNWDFNKDPDLWGDQPGIQLYSNGRVAMLNLEGYNFKGDLPAAIGQLEQLDQLYLGNHNDPSFLPVNPDDPSLSRATLFQRHKERMQRLHMPTPFGEPIARALKENGIVIPETAMYEYMKEEELIDRKTGNTIPHVQLMDNVHGVYSNQLKSIDPAIGKLKNLQYLYIANSTIDKLPDTFSQLSSLTDFEIYNCPKMTEFPMVICDLPELVAINISNNAQWSADEILKGIKGLANGPSAGKIQILYCSQNNLEELPEEVKNFKAMGLLDLMSNKLKKVAPFGHEIGLVNCYLDNNHLTDLGRDAEGFFCGIEDVERFSCSYNRFDQFPDIFTSKSRYTMGTVDFSYNNITSVEHEAEGTYKGIRVATLTLANNPLTVFPKAFSQSESVVSYFNMRGCLIEEMPKEAFENESMINTTSLDLSYNHISELPSETFNGVHLPYLYGVDLTSNRFTEFPYQTLDSAYLTVLSLRSQRDADGNRCYRAWPTGVYQHKGLRGLYLGSNDIRKVSDTISPLIYFLDISDNPNITFDASDICYEWRVGAYILLYDKTQNIINCDYMLQ